ncbi:MAG: biotin--[acetyl-CoA-carboxylase] ligase, partial [Clostridiales bacterium]|nr:biotin--[acetyl-CoA-carboxylase] ligase [Clostridiales bacterium]
IVYNMIMKLDEKFIRLHTGLNVKIAEECDSTFEEIGRNDVIVALRQNRGEGRGEHTFHSPRGGLYIVMRVMGLHIDPHTLTPAVGLAVHDAIAAILGIQTGVKWVNDIMYNGKKAVGILCKSPRKAEYLVGVGINYSTHPAEFEKADISDVACSLDAPESRASAFVTGLINRIKRATLAAFDNERYGALCVNVGKNVEFTYNGTRIQGFAESVAPDGSLIVRIGAATVAVDAGEVSIIREVKE